MPPSCLLCLNPRQGSRQLCFLLEADAFEDADALRLGRAGAVDVGDVVAALEAELLDESEHLDAMLGREGG